MNLLYTDGRMNLASASTTTFVELKDVIKLYETDIKNIKIAALRGVELSLNQGDLVAVIGPSGSGKTTLIKMIGGIESPSSGQVRVGDLVINSIKRKQLLKYRRYDVGFVLQFPEKNLLPGLNAIKNIILPMQLAHISTRQERIKRAKELLNAVGIRKNRFNHFPRQLSGGEAQRVALAVSLANNPKLVLADEPTGELDSVNAARIIEYIKELNKEFGQTFIVVTHDQRFATMTDTAYKIRDGVIYGIHKSPSGEKNKPSKNIYEREHLGSIDRFGTLRLPDELIEQAKISKYIRFDYNKERGCVEIYPVSVS